MENIGNTTKSSFENMTSKLSSKMKIKKSKTIQNATNNDDASLDFTIFDMAMKEAQLRPGYQPEKQRIDYVLIHDDETSEKNDPQVQARQIVRKCFEDKLRTRYGIIIKREKIGDTVYKLLHCPYRSLCEMAQFVNLEMPLDQPPDEEPALDAAVGCCSCCDGFVNRYLFDDETEDDYSGLFDMDRITIYKNYDNPNKFFRPALRSFLVYKIMINTDISKELRRNHSIFEDLEGDDQCCTCCGRAKTLKELNNPDEKSDNELQKINLPFLVMKGVYTKSVVLHEASASSRENEDSDEEEEEKTDKEKKPLADDPRAELSRTWTKLYMFQPLWRIRNYFGEKIALYFAWCGHLITSLWFPMLFGLAIFIYGLVKSINKRIEYGGTLGTNGTSLLDTIKQSFDNEVTPYFAMVICIWGTLFLEFWKRTERRWAFLWDVTDYEINEPDRPEFYGTTTETNPVDGFQILKYPFKYKFAKYFTSGLALLFMVFAVLASVMGVIVYRVLVSVDYCPGEPAEACLMTTTVASSVLNAISIFVLGKLYDWVAKKLTDWENHRTQTKYDDSLIMKLFAFQFVNNYSSCFYIAFFRGRFDENGILNYGAEYRDKCEGTCMSQLSFQILILMISKPLPKLFTDAILPYLKKLWRKRPAWCCPCFKRQEKRPLTFLEKHKLKENLGDFTLAEYTEKIIIFGFLMLFAASFPLAPLLALITTALDIRIDAWRLLWVYKRPVALMAQDIGTWYTILNFMNFCGVVSNGFLVAFTSTWGNSFSLSEQLWIVIGFEHIALTIMFIFAYIVPDTPADVELRKRKKARLENSTKFNKRHKQGQAIDDLQKMHNRDQHVVYEQEWRPIPRQELHRRNISSAVSAATATDIVIERPRRHEYQPTYIEDDRYEVEEYYVTTPVKKLKKKKKKRTRRNSVEDLAAYEHEGRVTQDYQEDIPVGLSAAAAVSHGYTSKDTYNRDIDV